MKEPHSESLANYADLESCAGGGDIAGAARPAAQLKNLKLRLNGVVAIPESVACQGPNNSLRGRPQGGSRGDSGQFFILDLGANFLEADGAEPVV